MVEAPLIDVRAPTDIVHADGTVALIPEEIEGHMEQLFTGITGGTHRINDAQLTERSMIAPERRDGRIRAAVTTEGARITQIQKHAGALVALTLAPRRHLWRKTRYGFPAVAPFSLLIPTANPFI